MNCRHCGSKLALQLANLGSAPPSNAFLDEISLQSPETWFPLRVLVCETCWLAQTEDFTSAHLLFTADYPYFSSYSTSWLLHCEKFVNDMVDRFDLSTDSHVVEIAANDGYLLQYVKALQIPCTGVEPTASTASVAISKGISVIEDFFGLALAQKMVDQKLSADLTIANNVLAHVPNINDFVTGFSKLLKANGVAIFEFPHLMRLIEGCQFDTIYHEHFSYLSLTSIDRIFKANGLMVFDLEELPTHGGSLRVYAQRKDKGNRTISSRVPRLLSIEKSTGMLSGEYYAGLQKKIDRIKYDFLSFLLESKNNSETVVAYGAAAKGNTLLNYAGVRKDFISCIGDRNPAKQGKFMPGSHIPIVNEKQFVEFNPKYIVILPWNLKDEIIRQLEGCRAWGAKFVIAIPELKFI